MEDLIIYKSAGNLYRVTPFDRTEPIIVTMWDCLHVATNLASSMPVIRVSRTVFAIWQREQIRRYVLLNRDSENKNTELIERGENLQTTDFMLISATLHLPYPREYPP